MHKDQPLDLLVRKLNKHVALSDQDQETLLGLPYIMRDLSPSAYIIREGDVPGPSAILSSGFAYRQKLTSQGNRQIIPFHLPGDALDLQHLYLARADHNVQALTAVRLAMIPRAALRNAAMQSPTIANAFAVSNMIEASIFREWLVNIGRRDARQRVAHLLCEIATRLEGQELTGEYGYELPMTQEQLADATGLTNVHVNRTLRKLEEDGLITRTKRGIGFPNWQALKREAGFNPLYLHLGQQQAAA